MTCMTFLDDLKPHIDDGSVVVRLFNQVNSTVALSSNRPTSETADIFVGQLPQNCTVEFVRNLLSIFSETFHFTLNIFGIKEGPRRCCAFVTVDQPSCQELISRSKKAYATQDAVYIGVNASGERALNRMNTAQASGMPKSTVVIEPVVSDAEKQKVKLRTIVQTGASATSHSREFTCPNKFCTDPKIPLSVCVVVKPEELKCSGCWSFQRNKIQRGNVIVRCTMCQQTYCLSCLREVARFTLAKKYIESVSNMVTVFPANEVRLGTPHMPIQLLGYSSTGYSSTIPIIKVTRET